MWVPTYQQGYIDPLLWQVLHTYQPVTLHFPKQEICTITHLTASLLLNISVHIETIQPHSRFNREYGVFQPWYKCTTIITKAKTELDL